MKTTLTVPLVLGLALSAGCSDGNSTPVAVRSVIAPTAATASPAAATDSPAPAAQSAVPAEQNPPGDIPDGLAFVPYRSPDGRYAFTHPEGWAQSGSGARVTFTDKLNGVEVAPGTATRPPTVAQVRQAEVPLLARQQAAFELRSVSPVTEPGGTGVQVVYRRNSAPDAVTGRQYRDEVVRYELVARGREVVMELFGPVGADNVDAYRTMVQSLRLP